MKVIKKGSTSNWRRVLKCTVCDARLLVSENDIFIGFHSDLKRSSYYACTCPCCEHTLEIHKKELPIFVRERIIERLIKSRRM